MDSLSSPEQQPTARFIQAVIFDSDGTLVDTRRMIIEGYLTVLSQEGISDITEPMIVSKLGQPVLQTYKQLIPGLKEYKYTDLKKRHDAVQNEIAEKTIKSYEGLPDLFSFLKRLGIKTGLFTSGDRAMIQRNLGIIGIENPLESFNQTVTSEDTDKYKPDPTGINILLNTLNVNKSATIVVGDHSYDMQAGKNAGVMCCIGVSHGFGTKEELYNAGADFVVDSLTELMHLIFLIEKLQTNAKVDISPLDGEFK